MTHTKLQQKVRDLEAQVERLRSQVTDWQPIGFHQIRPGMRVRTDNDSGVAHEFIVTRKGDHSLYSKHTKFVDHHVGPWLVDPDTLPDEPADPRVDPIAQYLHHRDNRGPWPQASAHLIIEYRQEAHTILKLLDAHLDALATMGGA